MTKRFNLHLGFRTQTREALTFYQSDFGGDLRLSTFGDNGKADDPAIAVRIMHGQFETPNGFTLLGGKIDEPPAKAPWGDSYGMPIDKFGTRWMVNIGSN